MPKIDKILYREIMIPKDAINAADRTVSLAFSSETPVERYFGTEILDHNPSSVRLGRLNDGGALLTNHDPEKQTGVVESATIDSDRTGRAMVRFGKSDYADEIFNDVVDGIRRKVSVAYQIHDMVTTQSDAGNICRVTDWEPFEISFVSIPADNSVGVGRGHDALNPSDKKEIKTMPQEENQNVTPAPAVEAARSVSVDVRAIQSEVRVNELKRINDLQAIGKQFAQFGGIELANQYAAEGRSVDELNAAILVRAGAKPMPTAELGMTDKDVGKYSYLRLLNAVANPDNRSFQKEAGFELELSEAARKLMGKEIRGGVTIPFDVMRRDLTAGTANAGGNAVATDLLSSSFIDLLRNKLAVNQVGATMLTGLNGNVAIPKQTAAGTAYWVAENTAPTESQQTLGQVTLSPHTVGAFTDYSRRLLLQSSIDVEVFVRNDLAAILALAIDLAAINGSGSSNQPTGILNQSGIGSVVGGTNGATVTYANLVDLESAVATANADVGNMAYLTNAKQRGVMKKTVQVSGFPTYIWQNGDTPLNGYRAAISNQVPSNLTKGSASGVCSAILFGNFADLLIGMWGGLDITVDPYTGSSAGTVRIVALQDVDINVRNAASFAAMVDAL